MAKLTKPLTNTEGKQAKPKNKLYKLADDGGLQLRVKPTGSKSWLFDYFKPITKKRSSMGGTKLGFNKPLKEPGKPL